MWSNAENPQATSGSGKRIQSTGKTRAVIQKTPILCSSLQSTRKQFTEPQDSALELRNNVKKPLGSAPHKSKLGRAAPRVTVSALLWMSHKLSFPVEAQLQGKTREGCSTNGSIATTLTVTEGWGVPNWWKPSEEQRTGDTWEREKISICLLFFYLWRGQAYLPSPDLSFPKLLRLDVRKGLLCPSSTSKFFGNIYFFRNIYLFRNLLLNKSGDHLFRNECSLRQNMGKVGS